VHCCAKSSMKPFMEPTFACMGTFNMGETTMPKSHFMKRKQLCLCLTFCLKWINTNKLYLKGICHKKVLDTWMGMQIKYVDVARVSIKKDVCEISQKTNRVKAWLGYPISNTKDSFLGHSNSFFSSLFLWHVLDFFFFLMLKIYIIDI
jgi:hypothetical protein